MTHGKCRQLRDNQIDMSKNHYYIVCLLHCKHLMVDKRDPEGFLKLKKV